MKMIVTRSGAQATVYTKLGHTLRVPLRQGRAPERQFIRWFNRQSAANPGFPARVKSMLLVTPAPLCFKCRAVLIRFLDRYRLGGRLRMAANYSNTIGCACQMGADLKPARLGSAAFENSLLGELLGELEDDGAPDSDQPQPSWSQRAANVAPLVLALGGLAAGTLAHNKDVATVGQGPGEAILARDKMARAVQLDAPGNWPEVVPGPPPPPAIRSTGTSAYGHPPRQMPGPRGTAQGTVSPSPKGQTTTTTSTVPPLPGRAGTVPHLPAGAQAQGNRTRPSFSPPRPAQARGAGPRPGVSPPAPGWGRPTRAW